jgi:hypothetical protein
LKASPATVSRGIQALFSAYRSADYADPEGFVAQLGTVLSDFPDEIVTYVTSPRTGLQRRSKWPPTINEVLEACEDHQRYLAKLNAPKRLAAPERTRETYEPGDIGPNGGRIVSYEEVLASGKRPIGRFETPTKAKHP